MQTPVLRLNNRDKAPPLIVLNGHAIDRLTFGMQGGVM
jgi:hypothetical protein